MLCEFFVLSFNLNKCACYLRTLISVLKMDQSSQDELVTLQDIETNILYTTHLSKRDAQRIRTDIVFASKVLATLKNKGEPGTSSSMSSTASNSETETLSLEDNSVFKWSHKAVLLLIEEYRKQEKHMISGKISQKRVWESISGVLCSHGHDVTGPQCQSKFNGMKRTFKSIKDHNSKSGNNPRSWPYTEVMESLIGEKPFMNPIALASSRAGTENDSSDISSLDNYDTFVDPGSSNSHKRKKIHLANAILESRQIAEENKLKRHQQTMDQRSKLLNALDKLVDKLQPR